MKEPEFDVVCPQCNGHPPQHGISTCSRCLGGGKVGWHLTPRELRLARALNALLPFTDEHRPWDAAWIKELTSAQEAAMETLKESGWREE